MSRQISVRLTALGLLTAFSLSILAAIIQLNIELNNHEKVTQADLDRIVLASKLPAENAVYSYDSLLGKEIVQSLLLNDFINSVSIVDESGHFIAEENREPHDNFRIPYLTWAIGEPVRSKIVELSIDPDNSDIFGLLTIEYNNHLPYKELMFSTWARLAINATTVALLTIFLITIFTRTLTAPLRQLSRQLLSIEFHDTKGQRLGELFSHREDELGILVDSINKQLGVADDLMSQIRKALNDAEQSYESLHALVENLPHLINVKSLDGTPLLANQAFLKTFELSLDTYLEKNTSETVLSMLSDSTKQLMSDADQEAYESGTSVLLPEVDWVLEDGRHLALELRKLTILYKGQEAILTVGVDITERKEHQAHIQHLAYHDSLTDLPNRHLFIDRLEQALLRAQRSLFHGALIFVDLDNFKIINDTRGHLAGDTVLAAVAKRLRDEVREEDTVARLGGDEFVVCMTDLGSSDDTARAIALSRANKLLVALQNPFEFQGESLKISASLGLAFFYDHSLSASELLRHADIAMYRAKQAGKNQLILFEEEMAETNQRLYQLKEDCAQAISKNQFYLMYQPQVNSKSESIIGAEALLRWQHPIRGLVSPAEFIPLLEETDMMPEVGKYVLETAIQKTAEWRKNGLIDDDFKMCINVSPQQFRQTNFTQIVKQAISDNNLPPSFVDLEITEGMIIDNIEHTVASMNEMRELGIHFSIDDFGTGYSNLNYLKRLPLDVLKVDQSFIRDIQSDPNDSAIVRTILAMADQLKLSTIAEGVETEEQLTLLKEMGCYVFQGYLYSPPLIHDEFEQLLVSEKQTDHT